MYIIHKPAFNIYAICTCEDSTSPLSGVRGSGTSCSLDGRLLLSLPAQRDIERKVHKQPHKPCTLYIDDLHVTSSLEPCLPGPGLGPCTVVLCSLSPLGDS